MSVAASGVSHVAHAIPRLAPHPAAVSSGSRIAVLVAATLFNIVQYIRGSALQPSSMNVTMKTCACIAASCLLAVALLVGTTSSLQFGGGSDVSRRHVFGQVATAVATTAVAASPAQASDALTPVYFGVGCFWHIQHEFVEAERKMLGRKDNELTSLAGYAGGKATDGEGRVCYHNFQRVADYGKLGHGEVVGMNLPENQIVDFSKVYFSLYDPRTKGMQSLV